MRTGALNKLTARGIKNAGDGMHSDGGGLFLRVKGGAHAWVFRFTFDGRKREMGLGSMSAVSLASAREKATAARSLVAAGTDPIAAKAAPQAATPEVRATTFEAAMRKYIQVRQATWSNAKHGAQWASSLERYAGALMNTDVANISTADVEDILLPIWLTKCETASRVRQRIERILSASIARGDRPAPNPAAWQDCLEHVLPAQTKVRTIKHHAAINWEDAPAAFKVIQDRRMRGAGYAGLVTLCLTGLRSGEVRHAQWEDIQDDLIAIPAARMKARKDHRVPVTEALAEHLKTMPRIAGTALIHPGTRGKPMSDMTLAKALKNAGYGDFTPHGWRSTFSEWANAKGWSRDLIEDQLAHTVGNAVERAYRRTDFLDRRRPMMDAWAEYLSA